MAVPNAFDSDVWEMASLTHLVEQFPFTPSEIMRMGLFEEQGVDTQIVWIDDYNGTLGLLPILATGEPPAKHARDAERGISLKVPRLAVEDRIMATELQGRREFGSENTMRTEATVANRYLRRMNWLLDTTIEFHRVGAIMGQILDSDLTVFLDLFTAFGVTAQATVDFNFAVNIAAGDLVPIIHGIHRTIENELGATPVPMLGALCGDTFFDDLVAHAETREAYSRWAATQAIAGTGASGQQGDFLRTNMAFRDFEYAGVRFINYRGSVGGTPFVAAIDAHFFPMGVPGLFITRYAPPDFLEAVNTVGRPRYVKSAQDTRYNEFIDVMMEARPLSICTRPRALVSANN